jgi:hypothetical protein
LNPEFTSQGSENIGEVRLTIMRGRSLRFLLPADLVGYPTENLREGEEREFAVRIEETTNRRQAVRRRRSTLCYAFQNSEAHTHTHTFIILRNWNWRPAPPPVRSTRAWEWDEGARGTYQLAS